MARDPQATTVRFPLFEGTPLLELVQTKRRVTRDGSVIWSGRIAGQPASTVIFSSSKNMLIAKVTTQPTAEKSADYYPIQPLESGSTSFSKSTRRGFGRKTLLSFPRRCSSSRPEPARTIPPTPSTSSSSTRRRRAERPAARRMKLRVEAYVDEANLSYAQSGIALQLHLVGAEEVAYAESENPATDLKQAQDGRAAQLPRSDAGMRSVPTSWSHRRVQQAERPTTDQLRKAFLMEDGLECLRQLRLRRRPPPLRRPVDELHARARPPHGCASRLGGRRSAASPRKPFRIQPRLRPPRDED